MASAPSEYGGAISLTAAPSHIALCFAARPSNDRDGFCAISDVSVMEHHLKAAAATRHVEPTACCAAKARLPSAQLLTALAQ